MSRPRLIAFLLALGTLVAYLPAGSHGFSIFDDSDYVTQNDVVQKGLTWNGVVWAFSTWHAGNWHPLTWVSHMADCGLFGLNPRMHHIVNVVFHTANAVLLFVLLFRLTRALWPSAIVAALFAWHPLRVESVAWISERKDVLSVFFALLALLAYTKYAKENSRRYFWLALIYFALGLLAKPMLVTLPFVMLLLDYWPLGRSSIANAPRPTTFLRLILEKSPFFALSAASCIVTFLAQRSGGMVLSLENVPLGCRLGNVPLAYVRYLLKIFWPAQLAAFYPLPEKISPIIVALTTGVLILISAAVWFGRKRDPYWLVGWLFFLGTLVPVIGLVSIGGLAMADRYTYFPSIGIFLAIAFGVRDFVERLHYSCKVVAVVVSLGLAACLALTENQLRYWHDDVSLFSHAIEVNNDSGLGRLRHAGWQHLRLGFALEIKGRKTDAMAEYRTALQLEPGRADSHRNLANLLADSGRTDEALAEYQEALRIDPKYTTAHYNLGVLLVTLGRFDEAMKHYTEAVRLDPNFTEARLNLGNLLARAGQFDEAIDQYEEALRTDPQFGVGHISLGKLLIKLGRFDDAMKHFAEAARLNPNDWQPPFWIGNTLLKQGRDEEAIPYLQRAFQINPDNGNLVVLLAQVLASDENPKVRNGRAAFSLVRNAIAHTDNPQPVLLDVLAMAYAELGNFGEAENAAQNAINLLRNYDMTNDVEAVRQRLQLYINHQPFRQSFTGTPPTETVK